MPVPVKIEVTRALIDTIARRVELKIYQFQGQKCVNIPTQSCETVPVTANNPVPKKQCFKKPRKVCQTLVSTKPKIVTAKIPREVCDHGANLHKSQSSSKPSLIRPSPKLQKVSESIPSVQIQPVPSINPRYPTQRNPNLIDTLYKDNYIERFGHQKDQEQESRSEQDFDQQVLEDYLVEETEGKHFL